jgi:transposase
MVSDPNEVSPERRRRRRYDPAFKRALVAQTQAPGASVARIAREHGINANQLFKWRRQLLLGAGPRAPAEPSVSLVPVTLVAEEPGTTTGAGAAAVGAAPEGRMEVVLAGGTVRIHGAADVATLQAVLASLRR